MENDVDITAEFYRIFLLFFTWVRAHNVQIQTWRPLSCSLSHHLRRITVFSIVNSAMTPLLWLRLVLVTFWGVLLFTNNRWFFVLSFSKKVRKNKESFEPQYKVEFKGAEIKRNNGTMLLCSLRHRIMTLSFGNHGPFLGKSLLNRFCQRNFKHSNWYSNEIQSMFAPFLALIFQHVGILPLWSIYCLLCWIVYRRRLISSKDKR